VPQEAPPVIAIAVLFVLTDDLLLAPTAQESFLKCRPHPTHLVSFEAIDAQYHLSPLVADKVLL
jgi:hypothetical protein